MSLKLYEHLRQDLLRSLEEILQAGSVPAGDCLFHVGRAASLLAAGTASNWVVSYSLRQALVALRRWDVEPYCTEEAEELLQVSIALCEGLRDLERERTDIRQLPERPAEPRREAKLTGGESQT